MRPAWLEIDLGVIGNNVSLIRQHVGPQVGIIGVVKSDGYGHGMEAVSRRVLASGADMLAVALVQKAVTLREGGSSTPILVLGATDGDEAAAIVEHDITAGVTTVEFAQALSAAAEKLGRPAKCHVKIDSGMGRQGIRADTASSFGEAIRGLSRLDVQGVFSHFASSPADPEFTSRQVETFVAAAASLQESLGRAIPFRHLANSAGITRYPESWLDAVRPGALMYGIAPPNCGERLPQTRQAMALKARVVCVKDLRKGESVGYSRTFVADRDTRAAVLPLGYADGYPRALSNNAEVLVRGQRCPVIGRVSMDCTVMDVGNVEGIGAGEEVVLLGTQGDEMISTAELAERCGTCVEEIVARMAGRLPRVYVGEASTTTGGDPL